MADGTNLVVQSNRLTEATYRMPLMEQRMILFSICEAREKQQALRPDSWLTIDSKEFAHVFNLDPVNAYNQLIDASKTLFIRQVTLYDNQGDPRRIETHWLGAHARIDSLGHVQLKFADDVIPYLTRLDTEFTAYRLEKIGGLTSAYAVRMYGLLAQFQSLGKRDIEIVQLRKMLGMEWEYPVMKDFKAWVIDVSVDQINEFTDLNVSYTPRRTGRFITNLVFTIKLKSDAAPKKIKVDDAYVEKHARPYETAFDARQRLRAELKNGPPKPTAPPAPTAPPVPQTPEEREFGARMLAMLVEKYKAKLE